jgi:hypothetical protein
VRPSITHQCGHKVFLDHLAGSPCPGCREANRKAKAAKKRLAAGPRPGPVVWPNRLPPGSAKKIEWTGEVWRGTLTVPPIGSTPQFDAEHEAATEREVCHGLHRMYVEWLNAAPA